MDEATVELVLKWKEENERVLTEVKAKLAELAVQAQGTNVAMSALQAANNPRGWAQFAVYVGIVAVAFEPLAAIILAASVALISFTAGAAAFITIAALVAGGFVAIGAAVMLLGGGGGVGAAAALATTTTRLDSAKESLREFDAAHRGLLTTLQQQSREQLVENIATAQTKYNDALDRSRGPVGTLIAQLTVMTDAWEAQVAPMARVITTWVATAIPAVTHFGSVIFTWFGERLPAVLRGISGVLKDLTPDFEKFGAFLGHIADHVGPQLAPMAEAFSKFAFGAVEGLLTNVVRLSDWFQKELPKLGPIVSQIFGFLGSSIQGVASSWAALTDWVIANWPATVKEAQKWVNEMGTTLSNFNINSLGDAVNGFIDLGLGIKSIADAVSAILGALGQLNKALQPIADVLNAIQDAFQRNGAWLGDFLRNTHILPSGTEFRGPAAGTPAGRPNVGGTRQGPITIHVNGAQNPTATGRAVANQIRRLTMV